MKFGEKLKKLRCENMMSQKKVAELLGITRRAYISYECEGRYPRNRDMYDKLAEIFKVDVNYLLTEENEDIFTVSDDISLTDAEKAHKSLKILEDLFKNGSLSEKDKDFVMFSLNKAYFESKKYI